MTTSSADRTLSVDGTSNDFAIAEIVVFDSYFPASLLSSVVEEMENNYAYLINGDEFEAPTITLHSGFVVESDGVQWARGDETDWEQDSTSKHNLDDYYRDLWGLNDLSHSVSGIYEYLTTDYLTSPCIVETSNDEFPTHWGFDPITTTAVDGAGNVRASDSYGIEIETLSICRRMETTTNALSDLPESTVCGLQSLNDENPTCQPTALSATWQADGVYFR